MKAVWEFGWEEIEEIRKTDPDKADFIEYAQWQDEEGGWTGLLQRNGAERFPDCLKQSARNLEWAMGQFNRDIETLLARFEVEL